MVIGQQKTWCRCGGMSEERTRMLRGGTWTELEVTVLKKKCGQKGGDEEEKGRLTVVVL